MGCGAAACLCVPACRVARGAGRYARRQGTPLVYRLRCGEGLGCRVSSSSSISRFDDDDEDDDEDERLALPIASRPHQSPSVYGKALRAR